MIAGKSNIKKSNLKLFLINLYNSNNYEYIN